MVKKQFGALVCGLLVTFVTLSVENGFAAIKNGQTCSKLGEVRSQSGKKFTCVKSGVSKKWRATPTITAQPSPVKPSASPNSIESPRPAASSESVASPAISAIPLDAAGGFNVYLVAHQRVVEETAQLRSTPTFDIKFSPNVNPNRGRDHLKFLNEGARIWSGEWLPKEPITIALVDYRDYNWISPIWSEFGLKGPPFSDVNHLIASGSECNQGSAIYDSAPFFWGCLPSQGQTNFIGLEKFVPHEYTHLVQGALVYQDNVKKIYNVPTFFSEGSADFYGVTTVISGYGAENKLTPYWKEYLKRGYMGEDAKSLLRTSSSEKVKELILDSMKGGRIASSHAYYTGSYATARLVAAGGHKKFASYLRESGKLGDPFKAFAAMYGISFEEFAAIIAPEIRKLASENLL